MKTVKLIFGTLAALWALALAIELPSKLSSLGGVYAPSHLIGVLVGIVVMAGISFLLFRSALRKPSPASSE